MLEKISSDVVRSEILLILETKERGTAAKSSAAVCFIPETLEDRKPCGWAQPVTACFSFESVYCQGISSSGCYRNNYTTELWDSKADGC